MKWSVKHVDLITTVVDVDMARSSFAIMIMTMIFGAAGATAAAAGVVLIAAVFAAVYHAEVVAHRIGEPFGTSRWS